MGSEWVGLENFREFFSGFFFWRLLRNTLSINVLDLLIGFPAPIILALLLNEMRFEPFKRLVQTVTYMPHFISLVVMVGLMVDFLASDGLINNLLRGHGRAADAVSAAPRMVPAHLCAVGRLAAGGLGLDHLPGGALQH